MPIERQIIDQLEVRSRVAFWPPLSPHRAIADIMETALAEEKGIPSITVHPDDPVELLFWGAEDDLSALLFALRLQRESGIILSAEDVHAFLNNRMTVSEVIEYCLTKNRSGEKEIWGQRKQPGSGRD